MPAQDCENQVLFALDISCLINQCYDLKDEEGHRVTDKGYTEKLQPNHRELHYDIVEEDAKAESFTVTQHRRYHVRRS